MRVEVNGKLFRVRFVDLPATRPARRGRQPAPISGAARKATLTEGNDITAPMHGVVVELPLTEGTTVGAGDVVAVIEAMKMMNEIPGAQRRNRREGSRRDGDDRGSPHTTRHPDVAAE